MGIKEWWRGVLTDIDKQEPIADKYVDDLARKEKTARWLAFGFSVAVIVIVVFAVRACAT